MIGESLVYHGDGKDDGAIGSAEAPVKELPPPPYQPPVTVPRAPVAPSPPQSSSLGTPGRKRGRSGSRQRKRQKQPPGISKSARTRRYRLMRRVLDALREWPVLHSAANKAGIHRKTLEYWIKRSEAGHAGYELVYQGIKWGFHEHCKAAIDEAHQKLKDDMLQRALGYDKVLTHRGRVMYKIDQGRVALGHQGADAYLKDENGNPVPETIRVEDTKAQLYILEQDRPNRWGKPPKIGAAHEGSVHVIGQITEKPKYNTAASVKARKWKAAARLIRKAKD